MISRNLLGLACSILYFSPNAQAVSAGGIEIVGSTLVSAMMMFLGSQDKVYMLDKVEGNPTQINGHSAYAVEWDIATSKATTMDVITNPFCASGMHFPNGSFATFGGNGAIGPGGNISAVIGPTGTGLFSPEYDDWDGEKAVRILNPCKSGDAISQCQWYDNSTTMAKRRWYSSAEGLADGSIILVGGFVNGGYINRNYPSLEPTQGGAAELTYEFYPPRAQEPQIMQFMIKTGGLNAYAHLFLMPSGKMLAQANYSTILWDYNNNIETPLPDMPGQIARVYPASGAVAMLPLTPQNNWTPTVLFCGGTFIPDNLWGNYSWPFTDVWKIPASKDCQRITPEPQDPTATVAYEQDDDLLEGRTMGQFIALPDGTLLVINGGANGTAGYSTQTLTTLLYGDMPNGMSLAAGPVLTPAIYNPNAPKGSRWSDAGLQASTIPRLYHSSALLLPDASVLVAGSNPNVDYNASTTFVTEYRAERFYPPYYTAKRPNPSGIPPTLGYGGDPVDITLGADSYSGGANEAADNTTVVVIRPGFTTHAMNMGQRHLQLNNTYTVSDNGTITLHVSQVPPNANLLTPGPVLFFVVVHGIPSNGTMITIGNGQIGAQTINPVTVLPASVKATTNVSGTGGSGAGSGESGGGGSGSGSSNGGSHSLGVIIGAAAGGAVLLLVLGTLIFCCIRRGKRNTSQSKNGSGPAGGLSQPGMSYKDSPARQSDAFIPLQQYNNAAFHDTSPTSSRADLHAPGDHRYSDYDTPHRNSDVSAYGSGGSLDHFEPPRDPHATMPGRAT